MGPQVTGIASLMGIELKPWQQYVLDVALEIQSADAGDPFPGQWAYDDVVVTAPRRAGKTFLVQPMVVHRAELIKRASIMMTAQSGIYASERWADLSESLEDSAYLKDRVRKRSTIGREVLTWLKNQSTLRPFSPRAKAIHGGEPDLILIDEFWEFDAEQGQGLEQAIRPTFLTNPGQCWRYSTAGTTASAWYNAARRKGRAAVEAGVAIGKFYIEWSVPEEIDDVPVAELGDEALIRLVVDNHPLRDDPKTEPFLRQELADAEDRLDWLRAYGNHVRVDVAHQPIVTAQVMARSLAQAEPTLVNEIPKAVRVGLGFDLDPDKRQGSIAAAWRDDQGRALTTVIQCRVGTQWLTPEVAGILERGLNDYPAVAAWDTVVTRDAIDQLVKSGTTVLGLTAKDYAASCNRWFDGTTSTVEDGSGVKILAPTVFHQGDPDLLTAIREAGWRNMGDGKTFAVRGLPITALTATALAVWAYDHLPEPEHDPGQFKIR